VTDFNFIDDRPGVVFTLRGVASQPGADRLLRPYDQQQFAAMLEIGFGSFFDEFARQLMAGQLAALAGGRPGDADQLSDLWRPVTAFPGFGGGYLQGAVADFADGQKVFRPDRQMISAYLVAGQLLEIQALEIALQSGSLFADIMAGLGGAGALAAAVFFFVQPDYNNLRQDWAWNQRIERVMDGQRCVMDIGAKININELRRIAVNDLRLTDRPLSDAERRERVCYQQLLLRTAGVYPGEIDGVDGPLTRRAKLEYAKRVGLAPSDIDTPVFINALIDSVHRKI